MPLPLASAACRMRFAVFELDLRSGELRKSGRRVRLSGQPVQLLGLLLKRPGQVVTREEMRRELWPADTSVDFEHNLNSAMKRLRAALGDSADTPRFIETLPRRGYRFLVPVEVELIDAEYAAHPTVAPQGPVPPAASPARPVIRWAVVLALAAVAAGLAGWRLARSPTPAAAPGEIRSLAVLPFENLSSDPDQGFFADGMTEALITSLAQIKSLRVISRTSVMSYRGVDRPIAQIARELAVDAIVEGSVLRGGDQVRITAQLIHAGSDRHLWAASYDGPVRDVLNLQNKVARAVAVEVRATLSPPEEARLVKTAHVDPAVHELYLRGRHLVSRRTEPELRRALEYFQQALAKDPQNALAHAGVAHVWDALASWPGYVPPKEGYPRAKAAAIRALALDDSLAEAETALASVNELYDWDLAAAERRYQRAIALNPNYALAHLRFSQLLGRTGRPEAALEAAERARALDPLSIDTNVGLSMRLIIAGRPKDALAHMLAGVELDRNYFDTYVHLADLYQRLGSVPEALAAAERAVELSDRNPHAVHGLALIYVRQGQPAKARPLIAELEVKPGQKNPYDIATAHLQLGDTGSALRWLQRACDDQTPAMAFLKTAQESSQFDAVRNDPRFIRIVECVENKRQ